MAKQFTYRQAFSLLQKWPKDPNKSVKDLGDSLRTEIKTAFPQGEKSPSASKSDKISVYERLCNNHHLTKYPRKYPTSTATGLDSDSLKQIVLREKGFEEVQMSNKSLFDKIRAIFSI